jgi:hypothetical protein
LSRIRQEHAYMQRRWGATLQTDPFYSPNLTLEDGSYGLAFPPRVTRPWQTLSAAKGEEGGLRHAE